MFWYEAEINAFFYPFTVKEKKAPAYISEYPCKMHKPPENLAYERDVPNNDTAESYYQEVPSKQTGIQTGFSDMFFLIRDS